MKIRIGHGYDAHRFGGERKLILGGVDIPHYQGLLAHSDGDVVIHALCDALLGALALGDIGQHFPDSQEQFAGVDSRILLQRVMLLLQENGYQVGNADVSILAQTPKLAPFILQMRSNLATDLQIKVSEVSVKATTTERMGFVGREEGIAVYAVVILEQKKT